LQETTVSTIQLSDLKNLVEYEKAREAMRATVIALKARRRVVLGNQLSLLFENRVTVLYQIQEMMRTERIVDDGKIQDEIDAYAPLLPTAGELSATLFIEIPELAALTQEQVRQTVNRFQGIDRAVSLRVGSHAVPAEFEPGHSKEEKMAAVQYVRFPVPDVARAALADAANPARIVVDHPNYQAETPLTADTRAELLADLS
jgi:Protein of unknown function (DUF3501)